MPRERVFAGVPAETKPKSITFESGYQSIEITDMGERGIMIEIDAPWAGSTESGFGQTLSVTITRSEADELISFLDPTA